jgi:exopolysaccharide biosynthesis polyprenyl glycosylphosphotransferase
VSTQELLRPGTSAGGVVGGVRSRPRSVGHWIDVGSRGWLIRRALLVADIFGLAVAFLISELSAPRSVDGAYDTYFEIGLFLLAVPVWVVCAKLAGLYDRDEEHADHSTADDVLGVLQLLTLGTWLAYAGVSVTDLGNPQLGKFFVFWAAAVGLVTGGRAIARTVCRRMPAYVQNTLIVGAGDVGQDVARRILQHPELGLRVVGFADSDPRPREPGLDELPMLGSLESVPWLVHELEVERVIIAFGADSHERMLTLIRDLKDQPVQVDVVPRLFEMIPSTAQLHALQSLSLVSLPPPRLSSSSLFLKRTMDLAIAVGTLLVLSPLLLVIALLIKLESPGPVIFRQVRMGKGDRKFSVLKFRTMVADADERKAEVAHLNKHSANGGDARMFKIPNDPRTTRVGRTLRRYSLDELPQLWNVVRNEMSLVGPRPLILAEDSHVDDWGRRRLDLKPGITGLWQVLGRDSIPFEEMVRIDYMYVTTWSLWNDIRIMVRTFSAMGRGERVPRGPTASSAAALSEPSA